MPGRQFSVGGGYRYGFNGKENDCEVKGEGNQQDYGMRIYDTRLGRFLSVDPIYKDYPGLTPYQFASNSPIANIDLDGLEKAPSTQGNEMKKPILKNQNSSEIEALITSQKAQWEKEHGEWKSRGSISERFRRIAELAKKDPNLASGQFYAAAEELTGGEKLAIFEGRDEATQEDEYQAYINTGGFYLGLLTLRLPVKGPYQIAKAGGKHAGWLKQYLNKSIKELQRAVKSLDDNIIEHQNLLKDPKKYWKHYGKDKKFGKDWDDLDSRQQKALLETEWKDHLQRNKEQKKIIEGLIKEKSK